MVDDPRRVTGCDHGFRVGMAGPVVVIGIGRGVALECESQELAQ